VTVDSACTYYQCNPNWQLTFDSVDGWSNDDAKAAAAICANESRSLNIGDCLFTATYTVWDAIGDGEPPVVTVSP
jgi:hypothetical protein